MQRSEFSQSQYSDAFPDGVGNHFWHLARNRLIAATLRRCLPTAGRVLEIGCGPAIVLRYLREIGVDCWGCELGAPHLPAPMRPFVFVEQDCFRLDPEFRHGVSGLLLLDVLEHIEDDISFLRALVEAFPNCRALIVTVPSRRELWSNYDEHYGHFRRYNRADLATALDASGFTLLHQRYFFHELYLPVLLSAKMRGQREIEVRSPTHLDLHRFLAALSGLCSSIMPAGFPGTSLIAAAVAKRDRKE